MKGVSVVVCCYNSVPRLRETIRHLALQKVASGIVWEVIIIDNASTDNTATAAIQEWNKYGTPIPFSLFREGVPGLSAARQRGVKEAKFEIVIFCDDDNWLDEQYVSNSFSLLDADESLAAVGGNNIGAYEKERPSWMDRFEVSYAIGRQGTDPFSVLKGDGYLNGAGLAFKKSIYLSLFANGFQQFLTDRIGKKIVSGGDVELSYLFRLNGYRLLYSSQLRLRHYMPASRMTVAYLTRMRHHYPESFLVFEAYRVLLRGELSESVYSSVWYWRKNYFTKLLYLLKRLPAFIAARRNQQVEQYLIWETNFLYYVHGLFHSGKLVKRIAVLKKNFVHE